MYRRLTTNSEVAHLALGGAATCSKGFVACFLYVPLACLGSMAAAVQPNSLGTLKKQFTKPSVQVAAPPTVVVLVDLAVKRNFKFNVNIG